jgi:hypothetical protein
MAGVRMVSMAPERANRPLDRAKFFPGVSSVMMTLAAGLWNAPMKLSRKLMPYRCHTRSRPVSVSTRIAAEPSAAKPSPSTMIFFLSQRSASAPARKEKKTLGRKVNAER